MKRLVMIVGIVLWNITPCAAQRWNEFGINVTGLASKLLQRNDRKTGPRGLFDVAGSRMNRSRLRGFRYALGMQGGDDLPEDEIFFNFRFGVFWLVPLKPIGDHKSCKWEMLFGADILVLTDIATLNRAFDGDPVLALGTPIGIRYNLNHRINICTEANLLLYLDPLLGQSRLQLLPPFNIFVNLKFKR